MNDKRVGRHRVSLPSQFYGIPLGRGVLGDAHLSGVCGCFTTPSMKEDPLQSHTLGSV